MIYSKNWCLFLLPIAFVVSCHAFAHDQAIKKLQGKTWVVKKECMDDSCRAVTDIFFYYHFPLDPKAAVKHTTDTASIPLDIYQRNPYDSTQAPKASHYSLQFVSDPSSKNKNIHQVILKYGAMEQKGTLSITSDSEFVLVRYVPKANLPSGNKDMEAKGYFRSVPTPKYISDITNK